MYSESNAKSIQYYILLIIFTLNENIRNLKVISSLSRIIARTGFPRQCIVRALIHGTFFPQGKKTIISGDNPKAGSTYGACHASKVMWRKKATVVSYSSSSFGQISPLPTANLLSDSLAWGLHRRIAFGFHVSSALRALSAHLKLPRSEMASLLLLARPDRICFC